MTTTLKQIFPFAVSLALLAGIIVGAIWFKDKVAYASVAISNEYNATTTAATANTFGNTIIASGAIATSSLTLGSVIITGATTGVWNIYDATTSDVTKRKLASSSLLVASFPASLATGTYTFDVRLNDGLFIDLQSGSLPTTTITWRR